jgi:hypothetical protein
MLNRIEALRTAMVRRCEHLRTVCENLDSAAYQLPSEDGNIRLSAVEADARELHAYRRFFESFLPEPINIDVRN